MLYTESERKMLYNSLDVVNGSKVFGDLDHLVEQSSNTVEFGNQNTPATLSIAITVMERDGRFMETYERLCKSANGANFDTEIVILDNSLEPSLLEKVAGNDNLRGDAVTRVVYHHEPRLTLPTAWNKALKELSSNSEYFSVWDSDIYCREPMLNRVFNTWNKYPEMSGLAPALAPYSEGRIDDAIEKFSDIKRSSDRRRQTHMPSPIGEDTGVWWGKDILQTTIMRGAYIASRNMLNEVSSHMPENEPWSRDFPCWQNVPLYLTARELDKDFGYVIDPEAVVVHDDRIDEYSIGYRIAYGRVGTIKDICQLMYRNSVFTDEGQTTNRNFLRYNISAIERVTGWKDKKADDTQSMMLELAGIFNQVESGADLLRETQDRIVRRFAGDISELGSDVATKLAHSEVFPRVKQIRSLNPAKEMYT